MTVHIGFIDDNVLFFRDLKKNEAFRVKGRDNVYIKVQEKNSDRYWAYSIVDGQIFPGTYSEIERVDVRVDIQKPSIKCGAPPKPSIKCGAPPIVQFPFWLKQ